MNPFDFANILLSGPCNQRCPGCIGERLEGRFPGNLNQYPPTALEAFASRLRAAGTRQVSLTGTNTDPLLYRHHERLVTYLRSNLPAVKLSLHTNGRLILPHLAEFHLYDRACVSFPSFDPETSRRMTGGMEPIDLERIFVESLIPVKISMLVTSRNRGEIGSFISRCHSVGARRLVLRRPFGEPYGDSFFPGRRPVRLFGGNPVYEIEGIEVTDWSFARADLRCLNLFSDGTISTEYLLTRRVANTG